MSSSLLWLLWSSAWGMTLEEAWTAVEESSEEAQLIDQQEREQSQTQWYPLIGLSPKVQIGANYNVNQREVELNFADSIPDSIKQLLGDVDFGEPTVIQRKTFWDASFTLIQPIIDARAFAGIPAAKQALRAAEGQADQARSDLRLGVARAYWGVLVAREAERITTEGLAVAKQHAEQVRVMVDAGIATPQAALQADIAVARAERDLAGAHAGAVQAEAAFAALVEQDELGTLDEPTATPVAGSIDDALTVAYGSRADLRSASAGARAARANNTVSMLGWVPTVNLTFNEAYSQNTSFVGKPWNWYLGIGAKWTLWDGGARLMEHTQTDAQATQAELAAARLREQVEVDVRKAWAELERARAALSTAQREVDLAKENLRLAEVSYGAGSTTFLDLEDARVSLEVAQLQLTQERMSLHLGSLALQHATGKL